MFLCLVFLTHSLVFLCVSLCVLHAIYLYLVFSYRLLLSHYSLGIIVRGSLVRAFLSKESGWQYYRSIIFVLLSTLLCDLWQT